MPDRVGGICERHRGDVGGIPPGTYSLNALVVSQRSEQYLLSDVTTSMAVTHEIGHAFGADHDEEFEILRRYDCLPGTSSPYGNYLMSATVSPHVLSHNWMFSRCSTSAMLKIVRHQGSCLEPRPPSYCGNAVVEHGEQCDCGTNYSCAVHDPCCTPAVVTSVTSAGAPSSGQCQLRQGAAVCSPRVHRCCTAGCTVAAAGVPCRRGSDCAGESRCDGQSRSCPAPSPSADGKSCAHDRGRCRSGVCSVSPCQLAGFEDCQCRSPLNHACSVCCRCASAPEDVCIPASWLNLRPPSLLPAGSNCVHGRCDDDARCISSSAFAALAQQRQLTP